MSRYVLLLLFNLPFVILAVTSIITRYKMRRITRRRASIQLLLWSILLLGLIVAEPVYHWLFANNFTDTDSLSLFDVVQITAIIFLLYLLNGVSGRVEQTEKRLNDLHQELSIRLSSRK